MGPTVRARSLCLAAAALASYGCSAKDELPPAIRIVSPTSGAEVTLGSDPARSVPVVVKLDLFMLRAPGECKETKRCGHLHVNIDGSACDDTADAKPYNNAAVMATAVARFGLCPPETQVGPHQITVSVHADDHLGVLDAEGRPLSATVAVTTLAP